MVHRTKDEQARKLARDGIHWLAKLSPAGRPPYQQEMVLRMIIDNGGAVGRTFFGGNVHWINAADRLWRHKGLLLKVRVLTRDDGWIYVGDLSDLEYQRLSSAVGKWPTATVFWVVPDRVMTLAQEDTDGNSQGPASSKTR